MMTTQGNSNNKAVRNTELSPLVYARAYGFLYLIHFLSVFNMGFVLPSLIVPGDAAATVNKITASESLFRLGFVGDLISQTVFILLVLILYKLLKPVGKNHAFLMVTFALVGVPIAMLNLLNQFAALLLLSGADYLTAFTVDQLRAQAMLFLDLHRHGVLIAQIFWGLWLLPLGTLVFKSGFLPKILGVLLIAAGLGYLVDFFTFFLLPDFPAISLFTFIGELLFWLWLLIKGVNVEKWKKRTLESA